MIFYYYWLFIEMNGGIGMDMLIGYIIINIIFLLIPAAVIAIKEINPLSLDEDINRKGG
jgi:hypothetical protein